MKIMLIKKYQFCIAFAQKKPLWSRSFVFTLDLLSGKDSLFFSVAPKKVFNIKDFRKEILQAHLIRLIFVFIQ